MSLTNEYGAPDVFVRAVEGDPYTKGEADFSATELLKPPQIVRLTKKHEDSITTDVRDEWWKLLGKATTFWSSMERDYARNDSSLNAMASKYLVRLICWLMVLLPITR